MPNGLQYQELENRVTNIEIILDGEKTVEGKQGLVSLIRDIRSILYGTAETPGGVIGTIVQVRKSMWMLAGVIILTQILLCFVPVVILIMKLSGGH